MKLRCIVISILLHISSQLLHHYICVHTLWCDVRIHCGYRLPCMATQFRCWLCRSVCEGSLSMSVVAVQSSYSSTKVQRGLCSCASFACLEHGTVTILSQHGSYYYTYLNRTLNTYCYPTVCYIREGLNQQAF